jgi:predicted transcriptional regulator
MISSETANENQIEEVLDEENIGIRIDELKKAMRDSVRILEEAKIIQASDVNLLLQDDLNSMYQVAFQEAYSSDDIYKSKFAMERMKGIGQAMKALDNLIGRLEDDVTNIGNEISKMEME